MGKILGVEELKKKKAEYLLPCMNYFYEEPVQMVRGSMQYLYDEHDKQYLDCFSGVSVMNCGHCNPTITAKTIEQLTTLQSTTAIYPTQPVVDLAEKLASVAPGNLKRSFFVNSGSEAIETGVLVAKTYNQKTDLLNITHSLHGRTHLTSSLTSVGMWRTPFDNYGGIHTLPNAYCYRCVYNTTPDKCDMHCVKQIDTYISNYTNRNFSAMICETVQGNGGIIVPPQDYYTALKEVLAKHEMLLILDETQNAFGRLGEMFGINNYNVVPDIITGAKALGNGLPIGFMITTDEIAKPFTRPSASTLGGNLVSSTTGLAVINYIQDNDLCNHSKTLGAYVKQQLINMQDKHKIIGDVRGLGLMIGVELVGEDKKPIPAVLDAVLEDMKNKGFILGKSGIQRNVINVMPTLVATKDDMDNMLTELDKSFAKVSQ